MKAIIKMAWKILKVGGWAPLSVFMLHAISAIILKVYERWPSYDMPMHFFGGLSFAFFVSQCFQVLPRGLVKKSRSAVLELLLIGSLTATAATFWEFAEFTTDQLFDRNVQVSLANTMQDMALGIAGALAFILMRAVKLRVGPSEFAEVTNDWITGKAA
jgi:hypothetical protein